MLRVTSILRKEQEEELRIYERMRVYRQGYEEAELRYNDAAKRFSELKNSGIQNQSAEQLFVKLQKDVKDLNERKENLEVKLLERENHYEKLQSWDQSDQNTTEEDVYNKRQQVRDLEDQIKSLQDRLDSAIDRNDKLVVFRQASVLARKKLREKEEETDRLQEEKRRYKKIIEEKENENKNRGSGKSKVDLQKYGAVVREKIDRYKKMREDLAALRAELVVLQRTEQVLKNKAQNLEQFMTELEKKKGVQVSSQVLIVVTRLTGC